MVPAVEEGLSSQMLLTTKDHSLQVQNFATLKAAVCSIVQVDGSSNNHVQDFYNMQVEDCCQNLQVDECGRFEVEDSRLGVECVNAQDGQCCRLQRYPSLVILYLPD